MPDIDLPIVDNDDAPPPAPAIENDGFFPNVDSATFAAELRVRDAVTPARARAALIAAIIAVGNQLAAWRDARIAEGHMTLAAVPSPAIDGESRLLHLYRRATFTAAKAELVERYRDSDVTKAGKDDVDAVEPSIGELRRDSLHAVRDILGVGRVTVELI